MAESSAEDVRKAIGAGARVATVGSWGIAFAVAAVLAAFAIKQYLGRAPAGPSYDTAAVSRADVRVSVTATGTLETTATVEVGAEVTGRLSSVLVGVNDRVAKGQLLAVIDPELLRASADESAAQVASAEASLREQQASLEEATKAAERAREQARQGLISQKDLESATAQEARAQASIASAQASAQLARAKLQENQYRLAKTRIVSPIDGVVLSRNVEPGQTVTAGFQTPLLFRLAPDLTHMRLDLAVDEADVGRVREGEEATFTVEAYPDRTFTSVVTALGSEPTKSQGVVTYQGVLSVDNSERLLRPGMTCTATILVETRKEVLVVPNAALGFVPPSDSSPAPPADAEKGAHRAAKRARDRWVWVLQQGSPVEVVVRPGATDGQVTEIRGGDLTAGMQVIVGAKGGGA